MLYEWGFEESKFGGVAILHHIPVTGMADVLLRDGKFNDRLLPALSMRYERSASDDGSLDPEKQWIIDLHEELQKRLKLVDPPFRSLGEIRLSSWFGKLKNWTAP
ncbi:hypothetical protein ACVSQB_33520 [Bradyrhizobium elkanii]